MSDLTEWLKERRAIHDAATEGPWTWQSEAPLMNGSTWTLRRDGKAGIRMSVVEYQHGPGNADAIVDAHNTLPALLTAVEKVLELHHGERDEYGCWTCRFCSHIQQAKILYPCATVRAIEGAINE